MLEKGSLKLRAFVARFSISKVHGTFSYEEGDKDAMLVLLLVVFLLLFKMDKAQALFIEKESY